MSWNVCHLCNGSDLGQREGQARFYLYYLVFFEVKEFIETKGYLQLISDYRGLAQIISFFSDLCDIEDNHEPVSYIKGLYYGHFRRVCVKAEACIDSL